MWGQPIRLGMHRAGWTTLLYTRSSQARPYESVRATCRWCSSTTTSQHGCCRCVAGGRPPHPVAATPHAPCCTPCTPEPAQSVAGAGRRGVPVALWRECMQSSSSASGKSSVTCRRQQWGKAGVCACPSLDCVSFAATGCYIYRDVEHPQTGIIDVQHTTTMYAPKNPRMPSPAVPLS